MFIIGDVCPILIFTEEPSHLMMFFYENCVGKKFNSAKAYYAANAACLQWIIKGEKWFLLEC